jgi:hypothetical protein
VTGARVTLALLLLVGAFVVLGMRWHATTTEAPGNVHAPGASPSYYRHTDGAP